MNDENEPRIEFPCDYPIKVIGDAAPGFTADIVAIMQQFDDTVDEGKVTERPSRNGNFHAITIRFRATSKMQLEDLHIALKAHDAVRLVL